MGYAIRTTNLNQDIDSGGQPLRILHDVSARIPVGELTMLVGPSGSGKTTFISILSGILSPTEGDVEVMGHKVDEMTDKEKVLFRRQNVGFIFQQFNLLPTLTAAENAAMPLVAAGWDLDAAAHEARTILKSIDMEEHADKLPNQLSGGQQQRVAIARALIHKPLVIFCDEPTSALDAHTGQEVIKILRKIVDDKQHTIVVVTHDNRIYPYADYIVEMSDGRILGHYTSEEFIKKESQ